MAITVSVEGGAVLIEQTGKQDICKPLGSCTASTDGDIIIISNSNNTGEVIIRADYTEFTSPTAATAALLRAELNTSYLFETASTGSSSAEDFLIEVSKGNVSGHNGWFQPFHNPDVDSAGAEDIWEGGGELTYLSTAETMDITSTSDEDGAAGLTGALTLLVVGLDATYARVQEVVTMAGTGTATTTNSYIRPPLLRVATSGSNETNVGIITATSTDTTTLQTEMDAGEGLSQNTHYTVPAGKEAQLKLVELVATKTGGGQSPVVNLRGLVRLDAQSWVQVFDEKMDTAVTNRIAVNQFLAPELAAKTDLRINATTTNDNTEVHGRFVLLEYDA